MVYNGFMSTPHITLTIPPRFWNDHVYRELVIHTDTPVTRQTTRAVNVYLHPRDAADLLSDAIHHCDADSNDDAGLRKSAVATVTAIKTQYPDPAERKGWKTAGECTARDDRGWCPICGRA